MIQVPSPAAYEAARRGAALVPRDERAWVVVSGKDRASYLHGLLTNDITALTTGHGCYAAYLTPQGRMIAELWLYELGDILLLSMPRAVKETVLAKLDQFIFSEDVQLGDVTDAFAALAVVGPGAAAAVAAVLSVAPEEIAFGEHANRRLTVDGETIIVLGTTDTGEAGYDVLVEASRADAWHARLLAADVVALDEATAEAIRIESGIPRFRRDMDEETIPLEAGIEARAISLTKGCYVGQEVIIRVLHRGHGRVAKKLVGLKVDADQSADLASGTPIEAEGRAVGELTSVAWSPALSAPLALGYVGRDFVAPGTRLTVNGHAGEVVVLPVTRTA